MKNKLVRASLRNELFIAALVIGVSLMTAMTAARSFYMAGREEAEIANHLNEESILHLGALSEALWVYDKKLLSALVNGITASPHISYAAVMDQSSVIVASGNMRETDKYSKVTPLTYVDRGVKKEIGTLILQGDLTVSRNESMSWLVDDLPLIAVGTTLTAAALAFYFSRRVTRRLVADAAALESFDQTRVRLPFPLGTIPAKDEIELLETKFDEALIDLRASMEEKEVLLRELYHRTKNNMQTIIGLLALHSPQMQDEGARSLLSSLETKIYAMSLVHQILYERQDLSKISLQEYIWQFIAHVSDAERLKQRGIHFEAELCEAEVSVDCAIPFGLILSELMVNSVRHAFPAGSGGRICLKLANVGQNELLFTVEDDGIGCGKDFNVDDENAIGIELVKGIVQSQLGGRIKFETAPGKGFRSELSFSPKQFSARV